MSQHFVQPDSIVRRIWGKSDTILFIFAGAAAEFALNKAVDWLYFTGRLPADPLGRLFSTVAYARRIVFAPKAEAEGAIDQITAIHGSVEAARGARIPDWAYRDVLFMLIHYSIAAYELLEHRLDDGEKGEVYDVFLRMGRRMNIPELPPTYAEWQPVREYHLDHDLAYSHHTADLYRQYKKHLGAVRYFLMKEAQLLVVPPQVRRCLKLGTLSFLTPAVPLYKGARALGVEEAIRKILLPGKYMKQIRELDQK